jgi:Protein of unknown function (DUF3071)
VRRLEVVAVSDDGTSVLLASAEGARATHEVRIDARLNAAVRGTLDDSGRRESELSPKEIQARLRAGDSAEQVAKAAKVPIARVTRYEGPVISERARIIEQAQAAVMRRTRGPASNVPLGKVVATRLAETAGLRADSVAWTTRRRDDGGWAVTLSYTARGGARSASWLWQPAGRVLTSLNAQGTRFGAPDPPPAPRRSTTATRRSGTRRTAAKRGTTTKTAAKRTTTRASVPPADRPAPAAKPAKSANGRVAVPSWSDVLLGVQAPPARSRRST